MTAISHVLPSTRPARVRPLVSTRTRRLISGFGVWTALALALIVPVALIVMVTGDYRPMVVNSDTMAPTLEQGDVVINEVVSPAEVRVGDVVTYVDSLRGGAAIIERVTAVSESAGLYAFSTKGDASTRVEEWTVSAADSVGRVRFQGSGIGGLLQTPLSGLPLAALAIGLPLVLLVAALRQRRAAF